MIDALHCEFGYELMRRWNLPEVYRAIGRDHHLPECDTGNVLMVSIRLVDEVCRKMGIGSTAEPDLTPAASAEANALLINDVALADLEVTLEDKLGLKVACTGWAQLADNVEIKDAPSIIAPIRCDYYLISINCVII